MYHCFYNLIKKSYTKIIDRNRDLFLQLIKNAAATDSKKKKKTKINTVSKAQVLAEPKSSQTISLFINKFIIYFSFLLSHPKDVHALLTEINKNFKNAIEWLPYKNI